MCIRDRFTRFGASVEKETAAKIDRGRRIREVLKQPRLDPVPIDHQIAILVAANQGVLDDLHVERVGEFERLMRERMRDLAPDVTQRLREGEDVDDAAFTALAEAARRLLKELPPEEQGERSTEPAETPPEADAEPAAKEEEREDTDGATPTARTAD